MTLAFLLGRYLLHDAVAGALLRRVPNFAAIDRGVAREGWKLVLLLRLSPLVPYNVRLRFCAVLLRREGRGAASGVGGATL